MALEAADRPQTMRDFLALLQPNQQPVVMATQKVMPPPTQPSSQILSPQPLPKQKQPVVAKTLTDLRGYFILSELTAQGMVRRLGRGYIRKVILLNQELTIVIAHGGAALFNLRTGEALWEIDCPADDGAVTADGRLLALSRNQDIYLWDLTTGQFLRQLTGHTDWVWSVVFSPDGKYLASGSWDKTVRLWDVATGRELRQFTGHTDLVWSVVFSPDGEYLASGSGDETVRLWNVATGRELRQLTGHTDWVWSVVFSPDGKYLASGSEGGVMRLWRL